MSSESSAAQGRECGCPTDGPHKFSCRYAGQGDEQPAAQGRRERLSSWYHGEFVLDTPTWCRPQAKVIGLGVTVKTTYGYHVIVALAYTGWKKLMRRG